MHGDGHAAGEDKPGQRGAGVHQGGDQPEDGDHAEQGVAADRRVAPCPSSALARAITARPVKTPKPVQPATEAVEGHAR